MEDLNLENLKPGDKITTFRIKGKKKSYRGIFVITEWDERFKRWRYARLDKPNKSIGSFPPSGFGYDFMSKRNAPDYYYTANPKHIKNSIRARNKAKVKREKEEAEKTRRFSLALPIGDLLHSEYHDSEECYTFDSTNEITEELIKRLTDEQIITLKGWLGV